MPFLLCFIVLLVVFHLAATPMRFSISTSLFLSILMFAGLSCRDQVEVMPEEDNSGYLPAPSVNRIVKKVYKGVVLKGPIIEPEEIEVEGGQTFTVSIKEITTYKYDEQGRLITEITVKSTGDSLQIAYAYLEKKIISVRKNIRADMPFSPPGVDFDTIQLNERGLAIIQKDKVKATFNENGNVVRLLSSWSDEIFTIKDGNPIKRTIAFSGSGGKLIFSQTFEGQLRNRQPDPYPYTGRKDKHLLNGILMESSESVIYPTGNVYKIKESYALDTYGRINKSVSYGQRLSPFWLFEFHTNGIGVYTYEYATN